MPFTPTTVRPSTNAKVTVRFAGLLLLKSATDNTLQIGVHKFSSTHTFQVLLVVKKPDRPPTVLRLLSGGLTRPFSIQVAPDPGGGLRVFTPTPEPFVRNSPANDVLDFRWSLNIRQFHPGADFNDGASPIATLNAGTLYTPNLTRPTLRPVVVQGAAAARTELYQVSTDLAAAIDLPAGAAGSSGGGVVMLSWFELGDAQTLSLPRPLDPDDTTYTIYLLNDPPISSPVDHDELYLYYKVLQVGGAAIGNLNKCRLDFVDKPKTDEIPCLPLVLLP